MVEFRQSKDGGPNFFRVGNGCFIRDHPKWQEKHSLGPVSFDLMCPSCSDFVLEDVQYDKSDFERIEKHMMKIHLVPQFLADMGVMTGEGEGI